MSDSRSGGDAPVIVALVVALCAAAAYQSAIKGAASHRGATPASWRWSEEPNTALGALLARREAVASFSLPRGRAGSTERILNHEACDRTIRLMNRLRPWFLWFLLLSVAGAALIGAAFRNSAVADTLRAGQFWAGLGFAIAGGGLCLTLPAGTPKLLALPALVTGAIQALAGLAALAAAALATADPRKLKYGPPFTLPRTTQGRVARRADGIVAGQADRGVLPDHTKWSASTGGEIVIPFDRLSCGITVLGEKGSGKSRLLFGLHDAIRRRFPSTPLLIHDPKGEWYRTYFDPKTDLVFAPHFHGSTHWSIWSDFTEIPELCHELIATAVYAHDTKGDTFWMDSAVRLLRSVAHEKSLELALAKLTRMKQRNAVDKTWLSIYQVAQLGLEDIMKVELPPPGTEGQLMSIDDYLRWPGRIFLLNDPSCAMEQKGAFSLFLSAFMLRALSKPDLPTGQLRAAAIVDEALTFNLPPDVDRRIYALCRSKGLSIIAGAQRLPSGRLYERGEWATAEFLFGMKVIQQETQSSLARRAGQMHFDQARKGRSLSAGRVSISENDQAERIDAVPPEHFGRLAPRQFVLFHDGGLVSGKTASVDHAQRDIPTPRYDHRADVADLAQVLLGAPRPEDARQKAADDPKSATPPEIGEIDV